LDNQTNWSRRKFLAATPIGGVETALMFHPLATWAMDDKDPRVAKIVADTMGIDTDDHVDVPLLSAELPGPWIDLAGEMKRSGLSAMCMTFAVDYQRLPNPDDGHERFLNGLTAVDQQLQLNGMKRALNLGDLWDAHKKHQPIVIQSVEGGHFLTAKRLKKDTIVV
jgi:membrane dipeptidase